MPPILTVRLGVVQAVAPALDGAAAGLPVAEAEAGADDGDEAGAEEGVEDVDLEGAAVALAPAEAGADALALGEDVGAEPAAFELVGPHPVATREAAAIAAPVRRIRRELSVMPSMTSAGAVRLDVFRVGLVNRDLSCQPDNPSRRP